MMVTNKDKLYSLTKTMLFLLGSLLLSIFTYIIFYEQHNLLSTPIATSILLLCGVLFFKRSANGVLKSLAYVPTTIACLFLLLSISLIWKQPKQIMHRSLDLHNRVQDELTSLGKIFITHNKNTTNVLDKKTIFITYARLLLTRIASLGKQSNVIIFDKKISIQSFPEFLQLYREIFIKQEYFIDLNKKDPFIIDCGSNIGLTILFLKMVYPEATILGFEPDTSNFELLTKNINNNNLTKISLIKKGLANKEGEAYLTESSIGSTVLNSEQAKRKNCSKIELTRLSQYINKDVDLLKVDIEGSEMEVFQELIQNNKLRYIKNIILEIHAGSEVPLFMTILKQANFSCKTDDTGPATILYATKTT